MLNMKKGLAIVLAAATALTFAPVSTLSAKAEVTASDDGLTTTSGIDSISTTTLKLGLGTSNAQSLWLKEHNDNSGAVKAFRISVSRAVDKDNSKKYHSIVKVSGDTTDYSKKYNIAETDTPYNSPVPDNTWGTVVDGDGHTEDTWIVQNKAGEASLDNTEASSAQKIYKLGGAVLKLESVPAEAAELAAINTNVRTVDVKISALDSTDPKNATELDSTTIRVSLVDNGVALNIKTPTTIAAEGENVDIPWSVINNENAPKHIVGITVTSDPDDLVADFSTNSSDAGLKAKTNITEYGDDAGTLTVTALKKGTAKITVHGIGEDGKDVTAKSFTLKITAGNGKLRVRYNTSATQSEKSNQRFAGQNLTFTDDAEDLAVASNVHQWSSYAKGATLNNGEYKIDAVAKTTKVGATETLADNNGAALYSDANGTSNGGGASSTVVSKVSQISDKDGQEKVVYSFDTENFLPDAEPVIEDGQQTIQINATSDVPGAKVTYTLVAPDTLHDEVVREKESYDGSKYTYGSTDYFFNPVTGTWSGKLDSFDAVYNTNGTVNTGVQATKRNSAEQLGDYKSFSAAAGAKYGAVDSQGLVTLKNANLNVPLYVVIQVKGSDAISGESAARRDSTMVVPINTAQKKSLDFYAASENGYAEVDESGIISAISPKADGTIYLSHEHTSDKLQIVTNGLTDAYVTGDVDTKNGVFSYNDATKTISVDESKAKDGDTCNLVITTSSAPEFSGTVRATFAVEYHKDYKNFASNSLKLNPVSVSKSHAREQITYTADPADATVIFDTNNYYTKDSSTRGYKKLNPTDDGYGDVIMTSTGWASYYKNDGTVYVRAHAEKTGYAPSGYVYVPVTYGEHANPNDLSVKEDRVVVKVGETAEVHPTASTAISFKVDDPTVASAVSGGAIQVKGLKAGSTTISVTAAADTSKGIAEKTISIPVVVTVANITPENEVTVPGKVAKIKLYNVKGAKLKINYSKIKGVAGYKVVYKYKKNGKTVRKTYVTTAGSKTVSVPKNTSVKVWVRAYNLNSKGQRVNGSYKTASKKTDKK